MNTWLAQLRDMRRPLMTLAILFFTVMLLEIDLGHMPALARHSWLALIPVFWLPIALFALIAADIKPSLVTVVAAWIATAVAAGVGVIGSGLHMMAAGVDFEHLDRIFSSMVWGGHTSPNWPVAITLAAVIGFAGAVGAYHNSEGLPRNVGGAVTAVSYILIVAGVVLEAVPGLTTVASACLTVAALLLLAALITDLTVAARRRSLS